MTIKVLVVDDDPIWREVIVSFFLNSNKYEMLRCVNGEEAISHFNSDPHIGAIISDNQMPKMNGITLLEKIRATNSEIPFLLISANDSPDVAEKASRLGATNFIPKGGINAESIIAWVDQHASPSKCHNPNPPDGAELAKCK